jgi:hypothetical protein
MPRRGRICTNIMQIARDLRSARPCSTAPRCRVRSFPDGWFGWKSVKHATQWLQSVLGRTWRGVPCEAQHDHCRLLRPLLVADIDIAAVLRVIEPMWSTMPETGTRVRARIEAVLAWATVRGYRSGPNPAQWKNHLDKILPKKSKVKQVKNFEIDVLPSLCDGTAAPTQAATASVAVKGLREVQAPIHPWPPWHWQGRGALLLGAVPH